MKHAAIITTGVFVILVVVIPPVCATVAPVDDHSGRVRAEIGVIGSNMVLTAVNVARLTNSGGSLVWGVGQLLVGGATFGLSFRDQTQFVWALATTGAISMIVGLMSATSMNRPRGEDSVPVGAFHVSPGVVRNRGGGFAPGLIATLDF